MAYRRPPCTALEQARGLDGVTYRLLVAGHRKTHTISGICLVTCTIVQATAKLMPFSTIIASFRLFPNVCDQNARGRERCRGALAHPMINTFGCDGAHAARAGMTLSVGE